MRITSFFEENDEENVEKLPYSGMLEPLNVVQSPLWKVGVDTPWAVMARLNEKGELVLSGTGAVTNFTSVAETPWAGPVLESDDPYPGVDSDGLAAKKEAYEDFFVHRVAKIRSGEYLPYYDATVSLELLSRRRIPPP